MSIVKKRAALLSEKYNHLAEEMSSLRLDAAASLIIHAPVDKNRVRLCIDRRRGRAVLTLRSEVELACQQLAAYRG
jgi:hypothetical protein